MTKMVSAREFNQQPSRISRDAASQPVIITDRGKPSRVLMSYEEFERLGGKAETLADFFNRLPPAPDCPELDAIMEEIEASDRPHAPFEFD